MPSLTGHVTSQQLIHALAQQTDSYWSFILSFYVIAIYWGGHRRLMRSVGVFNANLVRDTVFLLLIVAALPFPTSVLGQYGGTAFALALYGAFNALATLALILLAYDVRRCDPASRAAERPRIARPDGRAGSTWACSCCASRPATCSAATAPTCSCCWSSRTGFRC